MTKTPSPDPTGASEPRPAVEVDVARTGGIAGITRRWSAQPPAAEASEWISLIDRCPWNQATAAADAAPETEGPGVGAVEDRTDSPAAPLAPDAPPAPSPPPGRANPMPDGFVWFIRATWSGTDPREAELPDDEVVGAWRELVDAVRDWNQQSSGPERPKR